MSTPTGPDRVPTDNPAFRPLISSITRTMREHRPVRRGEGLVGMTCRHPLCREPIFLTVGDGANHQSFEIIRTVRVEAGYLLEADADEDVEALADLSALLGMADRHAGSTETTNEEP